MKRIEETARDIEDRENMAIDFTKSKAHEKLSKLYIYIYIY